MAQVRRLESVKPIEEVEGLLPYQEIRPKSQNRRITQEHGSMRAADMLEKVREMKAADEEKAKKNVAAATKKEEQVMRFNACMEKCVGKQVPCLAKKLKMCSECSNVLLSQCGKAKCQQSTV